MVLTNERKGEIVTKYFRTALLYGKGFIRHVEPAGRVPYDTCVPWIVSVEVSLYSSLMREFANGIGFLRKHSSLSDELAEHKRY